MFFEVLSATLYDLAVGFGLAALAALFLYLLVRSGRKLTQRENERRCGVHVEEVEPAFSQFPPKWKPASSSFAEDHRTRERVGL
jgi:hypothetical protein